MATYRFTFIGEDKTVYLSSPIVFTPSDLVIDTMAPNSFSILSTDILEQFPKRSVRNQENKPLDELKEEATRQVYKCNKDTLRTPDQWYRKAFLLDLEKAHKLTQTLDDITERKTIMGQSG